MNNSKEVINLPLEDILPNRFQPRIRFDEKAIVELSESIKEHGVIQPIIVRAIGDKYEIIAGERRYKASVMAGKTNIPAIVVDLNDKDSSEIALIENVQRQDLTPIEEAISYRKILDMGYLTQDELATKLGVAQSTVANKLRLLNLDDEVQDALLEEKISERHARSLLKLEKASMQREMLQKIINERLTVRKTDEEIEKMMKEKETGVFDSIENNMMNNANESNANNIFNNENNLFNQNNINYPFGANITAPNIEPTVIPETNDNKNDLSTGNDVLNNTLNSSIPSSNDIEIIDFADTNETFNIPSMPIVEDIPENKIEPSPVVPETNNQMPFKEPSMPSFENNNVSSPMNFKNDVNPVNPVNPINTVNTVVSEEDDSDADERLLKPGRFFNILNYDNEETEEQSVPSSGLNNGVPGVPDTFTFNTTPSSIENNQNNNLNTFNFNMPPLPKEPVNNPNQDSLQFNNPSFNVQENKPVEPVNPVYNNQNLDTEDKNEPATLRDVISLIRRCADDIEKNNFEVDTEEFDFDDIYQVIFKIKK